MPGPLHLGHRRQQRLAGEVGGEVGEGEVAHRVTRLPGGAAHVRCQHDVVEPEQLGRNVRLALEHVEAGTGDDAVLQRLDERLFVDDRAARDVDEVAVLAEGSQHLGIDELARARATRRDDDEKIDFGGEPFGVGQEAIGRVALLAPCRVGDAHAEGFGAAGDGLADAAEADDAQPRAADLARQGHRPLGPAAAAHITIGLDDAPGDGEDEGHRQVGDLVVEHVRRVRDGNAAFHGSGDIDAVVADAEHRDDLERGHLRDQLARHLRLAARRDGADSRRRGSERGRVALVHAVVDAEGAVQRLHHRRPQLGRGQEVGPPAVATGSGGARFIRGHGCPSVRGQCSASSPRRRARRHHMPT
jgi:hypothetical protein